MRFKQRSGPGAASQNIETQLLNMCGKIVSMSAQKSVTKGGRTNTVANLELLDDSGGEIEIAVWNDAYDFVKDIPCGEGVTFVGCTATREAADGSVKVNLSDSAYVLRGGPRADALTQMTTLGDDPTLTLPTATFTPSLQALPDDAEAYPTCAAALAAAPCSLTQQKVIQLNRCIFEAPTQRENLMTQDGQRLYASCRVRDWSAVDVEVVGDALPAIYGCKDKEEVLRPLATCVALCSV